MTWAEVRATSVRPGTQFLPTLPWIGNATISVARIRLQQRQRPTRHMPQRDRLAPEPRDSLHGTPATLSIRNDERNLSVPVKILLNAFEVFLVGVEKDVWHNEDASNANAQSSIGGSSFWIISSI